jgi:TRAP-type mannitol/chloroaromatic compound transport system permease small subunit
MHDNRTAHDRNSCATGHATPPLAATMQRLLRLARAIDELSRRIGGAASWLTLAMVLVGAGNAVARYLGRFVGAQLTSNGLLELQWYLFSLVFLLPAAWALEQDSHVRVDVLHSRLPPRGRVAVDALGHLLLLLPFVTLMVWLTWPSVRASWAIREGSPDPGGLPRWPLKALLLAALLLVLAQGLSQLVKDVARLRGLLPLPGRQTPSAGTEGR